MQAGRLSLRKLHDINGTLFENTATRDASINIGEFGILMAHDTDTIIAFKDLKVVTLDQPTQPVDSNQIPVDALEFSAPYIGLTILLA